MRDLVTLPKAHLHIHLEAGMRPSTLADLAAKYNMVMPEIRGYGTFAAFSDMYVGAIEVLRERDDWERLADEIMADHVADGAVYLEPAFGAINYRHRFPNDRACWEFVIEVFGEAAARHGMAIGWMVGVDRVMESGTEAAELARLAVALREHGVVSLGLHNDEVGHPPADFVDAFRIAREGGLLSTPHAGELEHGRFVADSIDLLGAHRIEHGVRAFEVPGLVERLQRWLPDVTDEFGRGREAVRCDATSVTRFQVGQRGIGHRLPVHARQQDVGVQVLPLPQLLDDGMSGHSASL